jgi:leucyl-tRNA synthetase
MNFKENEAKWQKFWEEHPELYRADDTSSKEKKYVLVEFPYPSGSGLHVGHAFSFTGGDVYARFLRMKGYNVLFPMGWDAFGLPTENYAIKTKQKPQKVTKDNTDMFRSQMKRLAFSFDWSREVNTTDPNYYKWTQWIFIQLFKKGLAYKKEMPINWCPSCKIGLANEEVVDGKCERCGTAVERRTISQWVVKITEYADKLIEGLKETDFIEKVKAAQVNWINKSEGAKVRFKVKNPQSLDISRDSSLQKGANTHLMKDFELEVFTTRPDTLFGATFMVISPEHALAVELASNNEEIKQYQKLAQSKSELERTELSKEKTGVFSGLYAINPVNNKEIPIWISDFVLASYGTGAIMAVPAHDERDFDFAKKFGLEIVPVIENEQWDYDKAAMTETHQGKMVNSEMINGMVPDEAIKKMIDWLKEKGIGEGTASYHLRDWIFSRQHYWGEPIPMIYCEKCGWQPVPESDLPVILPEVENYQPTDNGESPLANIAQWVNTECPKCGGPASRETDTMPNWAGII